MSFPPDDVRALERWLETVCQQDIKRAARAALAKGGAVANLDLLVDEVYNLCLEACLSTAQTKLMDQKLDGARKVSFVANVAFLMGRKLTSRERKRRSTQSITDDQRDPGRSPLEHLITAEAGEWRRHRELEALERCHDELPQTHRRVFRHVFREGRSFESIAGFMSKKRKRPLSPADVERLYDEAEELLGKCVRAACPQ